MDAIEKVQVVRTNNATVTVISVVVGVVLLIVGLIFAYARAKNKGKIGTNVKQKRNTFEDFEDEEFYDEE